MNPSGLLASTVIAVALSLPAGLQAERLSGEDILADADARIEKHRKGDAVVQVVDAAGKAVAGATVRVEQTRHAFLFGSNVFMWGRCKTPEQERTYRQRFAEVLNYATLPYYWAWYNAQKDQPGHPYREQVARWCKEHGIATKGHPLAWNCGDPPGLPDDPSEVFRLQLGRITDCVQHFRGLIDRWDVVNEATHFERQSFWKRSPKLTKAWDHVGRIEFTKQCFATARKANPNATLLINDYRADRDYAALIEKLVDKNGKRIYDVIGIQSHMHAGVWQTRHVWGVCERFARFGVPLHFTETTVISRFGNAEGEAYQAKETVRFYTVLFSHPAVEAITWWDFSDQRAWKGAPAGWLRADMSPKPVFGEMKKLIKGKWWTKFEGKTDRAGELRFRGFRGSYKVEAVTPDGRRGEGQFGLSKTGRLVVRVGTGGR